MALQTGDNCLLLQESSAGPRATPCHFDAPAWSRVENASLCPSSPGLGTRPPHHTQGHPLIHSSAGQTPASTHLLSFSSVPLTGSIW